ncbi:MAG: SEC-C domain-containing protein [Clostridia bacterium]|nr:SEC-C domain-containing protein [Clostridia bacterium]
MNNIINIINTYNIYWYTACGSGKKYKNCCGK